MGNILGKNRTNKTAATRTKSPVDRVIRNLQICPQGIGKKKYFWEKQILETSPAPSQIQKDNKNGWQDATLAVPTNEQNLNKDLERPIPPPRKKRSSKLNKNEPIKNGFEDLFLGDKDNLKSKSLSNINTNNSNQIKQNNSPTTNSLSKLNSINNDVIETTNKITASTLPRKISKVGNKKSDKFFGENISDCLSDEVITTTTVDNNVDKIIPVENTNNNHIIKTIEKNNEDETNKALQIVNLKDENKAVIDDDIMDEELIRKINKEKGKLMFSIEKQLDKNKVEDDERFKGEMSVEEEIIVPIKRVYKHICDYDSELHNILHMDNNIDSISANQSGPRKPQRDLAKYKKSLNTKIESSQNQLVGENQSVEEQNENLTKCDHATQTGKGGIYKQNHTVAPEILDYVTQQANLTVSNILNSAEAAVEQQMNNQLLKDNEIINKVEKETTIEKSKEQLDNISDDLLNNNNNEKFDSNNAKDPLESDKKFNVVSSDLSNPEIKIEKAISSNLIADNSEHCKSDSDISKSQPSMRPTRNSEIIPPNLSNSEKIFRRCLSTQSYLTSDLIEKIALQANILSMPGGFSPEDALQCNDGSGLVSPNFKLEQKRSLSPQISILSEKIDIEIKPVQKIKSTENINNDTDTEKSSTDNEIEKLQENIKNNNLKSFEQDKDIKTKIVNNTSDPIAPLKIMPQSKVEKRVIKSPKLLTNDNSVTFNNDSKREVSDAIKTFLNKKDLKPEKILDLLQEEFGDCIFSQCLSVEDKLIIEDLQKSVEESVTEISLTPTEIKPSLKYTEKKYSKSPEKNKISKIPVLTNKSTENVSYNDKRRHSIDDLNAWFAPEKDFPLRKRRREASLPGSLDNDELFNGKSMHAHFAKKPVLIEQENEENIEKSANILVDDILNEAERNINNKDNKRTVAQKEQPYPYSNGNQYHTDINGNSKKHHISRSNESDEDDHSALLKFLEHEKSYNQ